MNNKAYSFIVSTLCVLILFLGVLFFTFSSEVLADDDEHEDRHKKVKTYTASMHKIDDDGNEVTGIISALLLAFANIPVFISLATKLLTSFVPLNDGFNNQLKIFNQTQKKYLMPLHYYLNIFAVLPVLMHFCLSSCRASILPETGMVVMLCIAAAGAVLKFRISPKAMRKVLYQVHTSPWALGALMVILSVGHSVVD